MTVCCRICLAKKVQNDVSELQSIPEIDKNHQDVMLFCLDIQISGDPLVSRSLCNKCYKKVISFYIFKLQAIKNDAYLRSQHTKKEDTYNPTSVLLKIEGKTEVKIEYDDDNFILDQSELDIKEDLNEIKLNVKAEDIQNPEKDESDNEVLSVLKTKKEHTAKNQKRKVYKKKKIAKNKNTDKNKNSAPRQVCELCGKSYRHLKEHMERHKDPAERPEIPCPKCPKIYNTYNSLRYHNRVKHSNNSLKSKCNICDNYFVDVNLHILRVHDKEKISFKIECAVCKKRFPNKSAHDHHFLRHTDERPFQCDKCDRKFQTKAILATHVRGFHDKERPFICHLCSNSYASKRSLQVHLRSHTNELPYTCEECGKRFRSRCILRVHLIKHTGIKNVACPICDKKFYTSKHRYYHLISHDTEKRHPCQFCGSMFKRSYHRARHERKVHGHIGNRRRPTTVASADPAGDTVPRADTTAPSVDLSDSGRALIPVSDPTPSVV